MRLTVLFTPVMPSFGKVYIMGVNWHERSVYPHFRECGPAARSNGEPITFEVGKTSGRYSGEPRSFKLRLPNG